MFCDMGTWGLGDLETWRLGDLEIVIEKVLHRDELSSFDFDSTEIRFTE